MALVLVSLASSWRMPKMSPGDFDFKKFGEIPVLATGRIKPLDTVAVSYTHLTLPTIYSV